MLRADWVMDAPASIDECERVDQILHEADYLRARLGWLAAELITMHGYDIDEPSGDALSRCVTDGDDFADTLSSIMRDEFQPHHHSFYPGQTARRFDPSTN